MATNRRREAASIFTAGRQEGTGVNQHKPNGRETPPDFEQGVGS